MVARIERGDITFSGLPGQAAYEHFAAEIKLLREL